MARIAIIGTGRMAVNLGVGWMRAGHTVVYGSRNPEMTPHLAEAAPGAALMGHNEALDGADVVVLAIPFGAVEGFAAHHAMALKHTLVIDISNPFDNLPDNRISAAEMTAAAIGAGARVVAAFKDNFHETLAEPVDKNGVTRDVHYAGDSEEDKRIVKGLVEDLGFHPVDCGSLKNARALDVMVPLMVELDARYGGRRRSSWKFLT